MFRVLAPEIVFMSPHEDLEQITPAHKKRWIKRGTDRGAALTKHNALTATFVRQCKQPGVYRYGQGLMLRVAPSGAKRWVLRVTVRGKRRDIGMGSATDVSLSEARDRAFELRKSAREGSL